MARTLNLKHVLVEDDLACTLSNKFIDWETRRANRLSIWRETLEYVFATDTTFTSNSKLPWSNKTTIPKLCQIRENLHANYKASMFPKRQWLVWEGANDEDEGKKNAIEHYMSWVVDNNNFYDTMSRLLYDYIDYGNAFATVEWDDQTSPDGSQMSFVGPRVRRISPLDIVFDPTAPSFEAAPKVIRSIISMGDLKEMMGRSTNDPAELEAAMSIYNYLRDLRTEASQSRAPTQSNDVKNAIYTISGYGTFYDYLCQDDVEVLTFYGDFYDREKDELLKNYVIKVVDRHKIIYKKPNTSSFGSAPIYHVGWRLNQDNLWAHSPLENLIGMQYRIDHLENMKADVFDLIAYPPLKVKGYVEDFDWAPMERVYVGDDGDVELMSPDTNALQADNQIALLEMKMEEMAGSPREAMGFRSPGEKTKYEVQVLENGASRIFNAKTAQFERGMTENLSNAMLELARRNFTSAIIRIMDDENKVADFRQLTVEDITGAGRIKPIAARHFAEKAQLLQNLSGFFSSPTGQDPQVLQHFSAEKLASLYEDVLEIAAYKIVQPYIRLTENMQSQRLNMNQEEQLMTEMQTPTGQNGDFDLEEIQ